VKEEMARARKDHKNISSYHEGYAILLEEVDEVWEIVKKKARNRDPKELLAELVQVGAMAQRFSEDCDLVPRKDTE
jgi:NTP pyrophosphatase (non-canonical NTP hydrolase)